MGSFLNILGKLFGNKYEKDIKQINPIVDQINLEFEKIKKLDNDQLRDKTIDLKKQIQDFTSVEKIEIKQQGNIKIKININSRQRRDL